MIPSNSRGTGFLAAAVCVLIAPAALFMLALIVRALQPQQFEPAHGAQQVVMWFAGRRWTLDLLLLALPLLVLATGGVTLLRAWREDADLRRTALVSLSAIGAHWATLILAAATFAAAGILAIVGVHMLTG